MKNLIKTVSVVALSMMIGNAWAACPKNLTAEQMYDCIVAESPSDDASARAISRKSNPKERTTEQERPDKQVKAESTKHTDM